MITISDEIGPTAVRLPIRKVRIDAPFRWLRDGARDLGTCGLASLSHGFGMAFLGWLLLLVLGTHPYFVAAAVTGFLLVAPVMATGLCELSRRVELRLPITFDDSLAPLLRERRALFELGTVLALIAVAWFIASQMMLEFGLGAHGPGILETLYGGFADAVTKSSLAQYVAVGFVLALLVFSITVLAIPVIIDRHGTAGDGIRASLDAVRRNPGPMLLWAAIIAVLTAIGFATLLLGMIVVIPLLGHATWRAYRELAGR